MPNVKGLLADPQFNALDSATQRKILGKVDPSFGSLSENQYHEFRLKIGGAAPSEPVDMSEKNYNGESGIPPADPESGFLAHATKTVRGLPEAFQSGSFIPGAINELKGNMQQFIQNPNLLNAVKTVPFVGPMMARPWETGKSGDTAGAFGDAVDIGGQMLAGRAAGAGRPVEPYQSVEQPLGPGLSKPGGGPVLPEIPNGIKTAADWLLPVPHKVQKLGAKAYDAVRERTAAPPVTTENRVYDMGGGTGANTFDMGISPESYRAMNPPPPLKAAKPVEWSKPPAKPEPSAGHVPNYQYPLPGPEEVQAKIAEGKKTAMDAAPKAKEKGVAAKPEASKPVAAPPPLASDLEKSGQVLEPGQMAVREHQTLTKVNSSIDSKVKNLAEYLRSKGGTAEDLDQILADQTKHGLTEQFLNEAQAFGKAKGNAVPKTKYGGLDAGSDSHKMIRQRILDMIEEEKNKQ